MYLNELHTKQVQGALKFDVRMCQSTQQQQQSVAFTLKNKQCGCVCVCVCVWGGGGGGNTHCAAQPSPTVSGSLPQCPHTWELDSRQCNEQSKEQGKKAEMRGQGCVCTRNPHEALQMSELEWAAATGQVLTHAGAHLHHGGRGRSITTT